MIAVVVLTYRADPELFDACLGSVVAGVGADRVVVVDNGQTLDRARVDTIVTGAGGKPGRVDLLTTSDNLGYAGGMNAGLSHALTQGADAVAVLNDDTVVEPGWLGPLRAALSEPRVGAVQPKLLLGAGDGGAPRINSVGVRIRADGAGFDIGYGEPDLGQYGPGPIELFTGGAVLFGADFLVTVGGFDERYFLYYEDLDLARRGGRAGWRYRVEPTSVVHHRSGATASADPDRYRYWQERNRLWFLFRHGSWRDTGLGLLRSLARLAKHPGRPQASAIRDGLGGARRARRERRRGGLVVTPLPKSPPVPWTVR